ncbi:hypothetical protein F8A10_04035 [Paracoccus kondratievae]|nr:hypothetical protein F8A10_04035 [Paracoccus kondratievae]
MKTDNEANEIRRRTNAGSGRDEGVWFKDGVQAQGILFLCQCTSRFDHLDPVILDRQTQIGYLPCLCQLRNAP